MPEDACQPEQSEGPGCLLVTASGETQTKTQIPLFARDDKLRGWEVSILLPTHHNRATILHSPAAIGRMFIAELIKESLWPTSIPPAF